METDAETHSQTGKSSGSLVEELGDRTELARGFKDNTRSSTGLMNLDPWELIEIEPQPMSIQGQDLVLQHI